MDHRYLQDQIVWELNTIFVHQSGIYSGQANSIPVPINYLADIKQYMGMC